MARLRQAQELGLVRKDVDLSTASDLIRDSIHSAIFRHTAYNTDPDAVDSHLQGVADIFCQGIEANHGRDY